MNNLRLSLLLQWYAINHRKNRKKVMLLREETIVTVGGKYCYNGSKVLLQWKESIVTEGRKYCYSGKYCYSRKKALLQWEVNTVMGSNKDILQCKVP